MKLFTRKQRTTKPSLTLIMGKAGSGKSSLMGLLVRRAIKRGIPVYCNHHVLGANKIDSRDLGACDLNECIIIIDEAQLHYDNRDFKTFSKENKYFFSNFRHHKIEVYIISQSFEDLDVKIRRQAQRIYIMQPFIKGTILMQKVRMKFGVSEDQTNIITMYKTSIFGIRIKFSFPAWKFFNSYSKPSLPSFQTELWGQPPTKKK